MSAENAAELNGGNEVSIKSKILENPSFLELTQEEIDEEIVSKYFHEPTKPWIRLPLKKAQNIDNLSFLGWNFSINLGRDANWRNQRQRQRIFGQIQRHEKVFLGSD